MRIVASGEALLAPAVTRTVIEEFARLQRARDRPPALAELTPREREVLGLLARGLSNPEICDRLVVSEATTKPTSPASCASSACGTASRP